MTATDDFAVNGVLGHSACRGCGHLHPDLLLQRLGWRCWDCRSAELGRLEADRVRIGRHTVPIRARKLVRDGKGSRETAKLAQTARERASRRLRTYFPDLYGLILCEERLKLGLEPAPITPSSPPLSEDGLERDIGAAKRAIGVPGA